MEREYYLLGRKRFETHKVFVDSLSFFFNSKKRVNVEDNLTLLNLMLVFEQRFNIPFQNQL